MAIQFHWPLLPSGGGSAGGMLALARPLELDPVSRGLGRNASSSLPLYGDPSLVERLLKSIDRAPLELATKKQQRGDAGDRRRRLKRADNIESHSIVAGEATQTEFDELHPAAAMSSSRQSMQQHDATDEDESVHYNYGIQQQQQQQQLQPQPPLSSPTPPIRKYNQPKNKKPVHVTINQQTVNGLLSLLLLFFASVSGCIGTIFIMSALTVIESLQTRGNCYLVSLSLAHLLVTLFVIPSSALQIMAGDGINGRLLCHYQWLTLEFSLIVSQLSFLLIAADNYLGYKSSEKAITSATLAAECLHQQSLFALQSAIQPVGQSAAARSQQQQQHTNWAPVGGATDLSLHPASSLQQQHHQHGPLMSKQLQTNEDATRTGWLVGLINGNGGGGGSGSAGPARLHQQPDKQKLRLAHQFAGRKEVKLERPGCVSYRNCCGRLKVLVWILLVWLLALAYTLHQHELSYGQKFCAPSTPLTFPLPPRLPAATRPPQPQQMSVNNSLSSSSMMPSSLPLQGPIPANNRLVSGEPLLASGAVRAAAAAAPSGTSAARSLRRRAFTLVADDDSVHISLPLDQLTENTARAAAVKGDQRRKRKSVEELGSWDKTSGPNLVRGGEVDRASREEEEEVDGIGGGGDGELSAAQPTSNSLERPPTKGSPPGETEANRSSANERALWLSRAARIGARRPDWAGNRARQVRWNQAISTPAQARTKSGGAADATDAATTTTTDRGPVGPKVRGERRDKDANTPLHYLGASFPTDYATSAAAATGDEVNGNSGGRGDDEGDSSTATRTTNELGSDGLLAFDLRGFVRHNGAAHVAAEQAHQASAGDASMTRASSGSGGRHELPPPVALVELEDNEAVDDNNEENVGQIAAARAATNTRRRKRSRTSGGPCDSCHRNTSLRELEEKLIGGGGSDGALVGRNGDDAKRPAGCSNSNDNCDNGDNPKRLNKNDVVRLVGRRRRCLSATRLDPSNSQPVGRRMDAESGGQRRASISSAAGTTTAAGSYEAVTARLLTTATNGLCGGDKVDDHHDHDALHEPASSLEGKQVLIGGVDHSSMVDLRSQVNEGVKPLGKDIEPVGGLRHLKRRRRHQKGDKVGGVAKSDDDDDGSDENNDDDDDDETRGNAPVGDASSISGRSQLETARASSTARARDLMNTNNHRPHGMQIVGQILALGSSRLSSSSSSEAAAPLPLSSSLALLSPMSAASGVRRQPRPADEINKVAAAASGPGAGPIGPPNRAAPLSANNANANAVDRTPTAYGQPTVNQLMINNSSTVSTNDGGAGSVTVKQPPRQPKFYWLMLVGAIIGPSLASTVLFARAYFRMKAFKTRPYKPMPMDLLGSALPSALLMPHSPLAAGLPPPSAVDTSQAMAATTTTTTSETTRELAAAAEATKSVAGEPQQHQQQPVVVQLDPDNNGVGAQERCKFGGASATASSSLFGSEPIVPASAAGRLLFEWPAANSFGSDHGSLAHDRAGRRSASQPSSVEVLARLHQHQQQPATTTADAQCAPGSQQQLSIAASGPGCRQLAQTGAAPSACSQSGVSQQQQQQLQQQQQQQAQRHQQVNQMMSEPIGYHHQHFVLHAAPAPPPPSPSSYLFGARLASTSPQTDSAAGYSPRRTSPLALAAQLAPSRSVSCSRPIPRDTSFSAPPSATCRRNHCSSEEMFSGAANNNVEPSSCAPDERVYAGSGEQVNQQKQPQQHYEFRRRQHHAQSFHHGCSAASRPQYIHESTLGPVVFEGRLIGRQRPPPPDSDAQLDTDAFQMSPAMAQHQSLLERHRSLPRSSRLYQTESGRPQLIVETASEPLRYGHASYRQQQQQQQQQQHPSPARLQQVPTAAVCAAPGELEPPALKGDTAGDRQSVADESVSSALLASVMIKSMDEAEDEEDDEEMEAASPVDLAGSENKLTALRQHDAAADGIHRSSLDDTSRSQQWTGRGGGNSNSNSNANGNSDNSNKPAVGAAGKDNKAILCTYSYMTDDQLLKSNIIVFALNLTLWLPFVVLTLVAQYREHLTQELKDGAWWMATLNCCACSYVYAVTNKDFREAFNKLFYYCCCKSHVAFQRKTPIFRRQLDMDSKGNLRVHIIPGLNVYANKFSRGGGPMAAPGLHSSMPAGNSLGGSHHYSAPLHHHHHHHHYHQSGGGAHDAHTLADGGGGGHSTTGAPRHYMSVGGGFGGPLFAATRSDGGGAGRGYGRRYQQHAAAASEL